MCGMPTSLLAGLGGAEVGELHSTPSLLPCPPTAAADSLAAAAAAALAATSAAIEQACRASRMSPLPLYICRRWQRAVKVWWGGSVQEQGASCLHSESAAGMPAELPKQLRPGPPGLSQPRVHLQRQPP